jgi:hypothetical protein
MPSEFNIMDTDAIRSGLMDDDHMLLEHPPGRLRQLGFLLATLALGTGTPLVLTEFGLRLTDDTGFEVRDLRPVPWGLPPQAMAEYDEVLGYVPKADSSYTWRGGWTANIDSERIRRNGSIDSERMPQTPGVLAVGDSSAFGDEVEDPDTWPARLEVATGRRVWNAGMGGYGIDQIVLRAERLMTRFDADLIVISFVSDDVTRCAYTYRERWKPIFSLGPHGLVFTPPPPPEVPLPRSRWWTLLGHSHLARFVMTRIAPQTWRRTAYRRIHDDEREVAGSLIARLARAADASGKRLLVVALAGANQDTQHVADLLSRAQAAGIAILDLTPKLIRMALAPHERERWFRPKLHLSGHANDWVASQIANRIEALGWSNRSTSSGRSDRTDSRASRSGSAQ